MIFRIIGFGANPGAALSASPDILSEEAASTVRL
jgi:hypothetical protein